MTSVKLKVPVVRRNTLVVDAVIAVALAALVLIVAPGLAIVAMFAILVLIICGVSFLLDAKHVRAGRRRAPQRRSPAPPTRRSGRSR
jgi:ABC-type bacteriocin/lantibiotic exporter with double-glycine peptidase domain